MSTTYTGVKHSLSFWQIWNMCFGFFGIQFGWSLQMGNMSAIYEYLGASPEQIPGLWLAAPMTGLLVQPIIGYLSDRTWHPRLGRRRPFFLVGAILSSLTLFIMPNASVIWMAAGMLWILDSSINITMEPFRAFVADNLDEQQRPYGFAMQSMFIGLASFIAGYLPQKLVEWFGVSRDKAGGAIPQNIMLSFYIGGFVFLVAVLYTVFRSKEYPPSDLNWREKVKESNKGFGGGIKEITSSILQMPAQMKRLALVNFITWPGLFLMWFYYSTGVAAEIFGGDVKGNSELYTRGLEYANTTSAILNLVTFAFSFSLPFWVKKMGKKYTHTTCLLLGGLGLIAVNHIHEPAYLYVAMGLVGIAWASILSMPYSMLAGCLPADKMGIYMGVFNFFIVLPEIIASLFFGKIMNNFLHNDRLLAVQVGGCMLCIAALVCALVVKEKKD
ncbi:maltose/moltooligosaccharide transporter [Hydrobacter penzbergensis]|uniref:Maltose/moltooligosaccharide transporter n=1 Tax=Hydrobacter penzbergensis TaxID=1235997 RepID=A0A8X8IAG4_9BACT|nr:MFS transporter [Hydrobacter penzbergensis]SDW48721.1 maltose/moltooligosaccharide transporter [Hydrobacter penzbergensis]